MIQVNLNAVFTLSRDVGAYMLTRTPQGNPPHRGSIISIASLASFQGGIDVRSNSTSCVLLYSETKTSDEPPTQVAAYAAAKGGVAQLTKSLSNQWAAEGINVNAVSWASENRTAGHWELMLHPRLHRDISTPT